MLHLNNRDAFDAFAAAKRTKIATVQPQSQPQNQSQSLNQSQPQPSLQIQSVNSLQSVSANSPLPIIDIVWKVLVYDKHGQDIISPLLKVNELRECGVTVHMPLTSDRQPIPDVPAVYFVSPTRESISRIAEVRFFFILCIKVVELEIPNQDLTKNLYESYYLNFTYSISRNLLEELAAAAIATNASVQIAQVYDQYLNFISLEDRFFSLNLSESYKLLNDATSSDSVIESVTENIVNALFSVVATMGAIPIISCPRGNAAANVATKLDQRIRDHIMNSRNNNLFSESSSLPPPLSHSGSGAVSSRPVLIILDRNLDLGTMLSHTWSYSTLVHDLLDMKLNRVVIETEEKGKKIKKSFDIDANDFFWLKNSGNPFPQVAEDVNVEINRYKKDVDDVTRSSGAASLEDMDPNANAETLKYALTALPELTDRKRTLDMHMNIAAQLFAVIGGRKLDAFFAIEEALGKQTKTTILEALRDKEKGTPEDKLRLFLVYFLAQDDIPKEDLSVYEDALREVGCSMGPLTYLKGVKSFIKMAAATAGGGSGGSGSSGTGGQGSSSMGGEFFGKLGKFVEGSGVSGGIENLITGFKDLLPSRKDLASTNIVQSIMEGNSAGTSAEDYLYFDPKASRGASSSSGITMGKSSSKLGGGFNGSSSGSSPASSKIAYQQAIVFVVGGGNYLEYQNLQDYAQRSQQKKRITYGSTEIVTAHEFLAQIEALGSR
ncbi:Vesicle trafficking between the ER and Golgi [Physocladia obscura]|uniref:Vesicle trafficking between the ER and Golgi n=1 Tax=Physocladia obscura TaxID=109957 RepID=A0AAD5XCW1_9FUNG|nr:Vesicle trafficking between the ER and Golgi [Physocladia obscura]